MKTMERWDESHCCFTEYVQDGDEIDEKIYDYFLGIIPPKCQENGGFLMGEPYCDDGNGNTLFMAFTRRDGKFFYLGLSTTREMGC